MARFHSVATSAAALAANAGAAWLMGSASGGGKLRRVTVGVIAGASTPTSQQLLLGINRVTSAGTTPTGGTASKMDPNSGAANLSWVTAFSGAPTLAAADEFQVAFNSQSGVDLPWEMLVEFVLGTATTTGFAFVNRVNALPASHQLAISVEWEE